MQAYHQVQFVLIDENSVGQRVDNFLFRHLKGVPKSRIYRILRKGEVRVNKKRVKAEYKLVLDDQLRIPPIRLDDSSEDKKIKNLDKVRSLESCILVETSHYIAINKPAGMAVHGGSGLSFGVIEALRSLRPQEKFLELVHRLDRDTSGCLLIAKKRSALTHFHEQLRLKKMQKEYLAIVAGDWNNEFNICKAPLDKNQLKSGERFVTVSPDGKVAETRFKCLKRLRSHCLIKAMPITGRTHQIRVHAQYAGCPLLGDSKYNSDPEQQVIADKVGLKSFLLHAHKLSFVPPGAEQSVTVEAPVPVVFEQVMESLKQLEY